MKWKLCIIMLLSIHSIHAQPTYKLTSLKEINSSNFLSEPEAFLDQYHFEQIVKERIEKLNYQTPIQLEYNEAVRKYIQYFLTEKKEWLKNCIRLSNYYFPIFEMYLDKYELPLELKYLAVIESGLDPFARSKSGAVGLWQFLYPTSQLLNLKINSFIDERQDPHKSTEAACRYLEYLYNIFNDWQLAIAAYNAGPTVIKNAILRSGNKTTFWEIKPYLSVETQNYVPAFIAANYLMTYANEYLLNDQVSCLYQHQVDTVMVDKPLYLGEVSKTLNIPIETLRFLNPQYKKDYIPYSFNPMPIVLPKEKVSEFIKQSQMLFNNSIPPSATTNVTNRKVINYVVKKGDYLTKLAVEFRCSPEDIKRWNNLTSNELTTGSVLTIWTVDLQ
ncbi:MAG: transglycosylase SLT domain-containing protein [Bacteroidales bacterium]|nr:transglycosylase SLT domain-containing protein [Bacteroidales bacterium]